MVWLFAALILLNIFCIKAIHYVWREVQIQKSKLGHLNDKIESVQDELKQLAETISDHMNEELDRSTQLARASVRVEETPHRNIADLFGSWVEAGEEVEQRSMSGLLASFRRMLLRTVPASTDIRPLVDGFEGILDQAFGQHPQQPEEPEEHEEEQPEEKRPRRRLHIEREEE